MLRIEYDKSRMQFVVTLEARGESCTVRGALMSALWDAQLQIAAVRKDVDEPLPCEASAPSGQDGEGSER